MNISLSVNPSVLIEEEGTVATLTFTLSEPPPPEGIRVTVDSDTARALAEFNVFSASFNGARLVSANADVSGFTLLITAQTATVSLPVFNDIEDEDGSQAITFALQSGDGYTIEPNAASVTVTIQDSDGQNIPLPPVAKNDRYQTNVDNTITINAADGVLNNDSDPNLDPTTAILQSQPTNGTLEFNADGSFAYTPNPEFSGTDTFTYVANDGTANSNVATATITVLATGGGGDEKPTVSITSTPAVLDEAAGTVLTVTLNTEGTIPTDGVIVAIGGEVFESFRDLANQQFEFDGGTPVGFTEDRTGFLFRITEPTATIIAPVFDDIIEELQEQYTYRILPSESYTIDPQAGSTTIDIVDGIASYPKTPVASLTVDKTNLGEGEAFTLTLNLSEPPPAEGFVVYVDNDLRGSLGEFNVLQISVTGADFPVVNEDASGFFLRMVEQTATVTVPVFQDGEAEGQETFTFNLVNGETYEVDPAANTVTLTFNDSGTDPTDKPTVSFSATPATLVEADSTVLTLNFSLSEPPPPEGVLVSLDSDFVDAIREFDVGNLEITGGEFPEPNADASGFDFLITEQNASIRLPILNDGETEDVETLTFSLQPRENYAIDPEANTATLSLTDSSTNPMTTVSLQTVTALFGDEDTLIAPVITKSPEDGTSILSFVLTADGEIPEDGLIVTVNSNIQFRDHFAFLAERPFMIGGELVGAVFNEAGEATGFQFKMTESKALLNLRPQDNSDAISNDQATFTLEAGEGYSIDTNASSSTVTFYETVAEVPAPDVTPEVHLSVDTTALNETTGNTATLTFRLSEPPPPEGVLLYVKGDSGPGTRLLSEFGLFNATVTGGAFPAPDGAANGFFFKITEQTATLTLPAFKDEDLEGVKEVKLSLQEVPGYTITENAGSITLNVIDDDNSQIQVSFTTEPAVLIESEKTVSVHNFSLSAAPPEAGLVVSVVAPNISEFDLSGIKTEGGEIAQVTPTGFDFKITAKNARIELPVAEDGEAEGLEEATFTLQDAPEYQVNPDATVGKFQITDTPDQAPVLEVNEPNDTIEKAVDTNLNTSNNFVSFTSSIDFSFRNSYDDGQGGTIYVDASEDVDLYKVSLKAGDTIKIDLDSNQFEEGRKVDTSLRVFDANGNQVGFNEDGAAPDELFAAKWASYLEFTAPADGDYYLGVAIYDNTKYDPNVPGSGGGLSSNDPDEYGNGEYTLNISLNDPHTFIAQPTTIPRGDGTGPAISLFTMGGTYGTDFDSLGFDILAQVPVESVEEGEFSGVSFVLTADGEIPEGGTTLYITADQPLLDYLGTVDSFGALLSDKPFSRGGQFLDAIYDATGTPIGFTFRLEESFATFTLPVTDRETPETDGPETVTWSVVESKGYTTSDQSSSSVTFYDSLQDLVVIQGGPIVSLELSTTELIESEETELTLTFNLSAPPPAGGIQIYVSGNAQDFLNEFSIFDAKFFGGVAIADGALSGFYLQMYEQTATITLPVFNSTDITEGIEEFNVAVRPGQGYFIDENQNGGTIRIKDTPDSQIQVSLSTEPEVLIESEGTVAKVNFSLSAAPPEDGVLVTVNAAEMIEFDPKSLTSEGGELVSAAPDNTSFTFKITQQNASVSVAVADDGTVEGIEEATFSLGEGEGYQINPDAGSGTFTIVDAPELVPPSTAESNDTLETAIATGLSATNASASFDGEIGEHTIEVSPDESFTIDSTEDVDLYKVDLLTGQNLTIDIDATELGSKLQFAQIRVFDANGVELAKTGANSFQAAPDEVFSVFNDPYLEFAVPSDGTYYVGISQIGNDNYDATVAGSGSGWIFPAAEILPDTYTLNLSVSPQLIVDPAPTASSAFV